MTIDTEAKNTIAKKQDMYELARPTHARLLEPGEPDYDEFDRKEWLLAINLLIAEGQIEIAKEKVLGLSRYYEQSRAFENLNLTLARVPDAVGDKAYAEFSDDLGAEVQVVPRAGASTVLLSFGGNRGKMGIPLMLLHRWFGQANVHVIYLRDMTAKLFARGLKQIGSDYNETIASLRRSCEELGATRILCHGNSGGGFGAAMMGLDLGAEAVLTFGAPSHPSLTADKKTVRLLQRFGIDEGVDLRPLYDKAANPPQTRLVYSADFEPDRLQAENMDGAPNVTLEGVMTGGDHGVMVPLIQNGRYDELLKQLIAGSFSPPPAAAA